VTLLAYVLPLAVAAGLGTALWERRAPHRAALATLKAATAVPKAQAVLRGPPRAGEANRARPVGEGAVVDQVVGPVASALARLARPVCPPSYAASARRRLALAGRNRAVDLDRFLALRLVSLGLVVPAFLLVLVVHLPGVYRLLAFFLVAAALGLGPEAVLNRRVGERQERIRRDLPALLELLLISVEAGLGFDQALARAAASAPGPLSEEFSRYLGEVRMGAERKDALEGIDRRTDVEELRSFLMALVQAEAFGVSVGPILRSQADESRVAQRQHVQEQAQKAPVKMLFPLVFCVLPALFIVVIGPAVIEIYRTLVR